MTLTEMIDGLRSAPRVGADKDDPEGSRYIMISETLVEQMLECLNDAKRYVNR